LGNKIEPIEKKIIIRHRQIEELIQEQEVILKNICDTARIQ
jgi:hypothetical protein